MKKFKYISNLLLEDINSNVVIPCIDENGYHTLLIKNSVNKTTITKFSTDNLVVQMDAVLKLTECDCYFHIISATKNDMYSIGQFQIIYDYIFKKIDKPISGNELSVLITSIEDYFRTTPDKDVFSLQVGVFGELLSIKYLYENGYPNIINKYHTNFYSKHDIEIDKNNRIEIKSTVSEKRIHKFKHNQIFRKDINVYVISVMLEQSKEGMSLFDLFMEVMKLYSDPDSLFAMEKLMKRCNIGEENCGLRFSLEKALTDINIYNAINLPKIEMDEPQGVSNIVYDVDCSLAHKENLEEFINFINSLENNK